MDRISSSAKGTLADASRDFRVTFDAEKQRKPGTTSAALGFAVLKLLPLTMVWHAVLGLRHRGGSGWTGQSS